MITARFGGGKVAGIGAQQKGGGGPDEVQTTWGYFRDVYCRGVLRMAQEGEKHLGEGRKRSKEKVLVRREVRGGRSKL